MIIKLNEKKQIIMGIFILILVLFSLLGLTYAYFRTKVIGNSEGKVLVS